VQIWVFVGWITEGDESQRRTCLRHTYCQYQKQEHILQEDIKAGRKYEIEEKQLQMNNRKGEKLF